MTGEEKRARLSELGVRRIIFDDFENVRCLSPKEFAEKVLFERLNAGAVSLWYGLSVQEKMRRVERPVQSAGQLCRSAKRSFSFNG